MINRIPTSVAMVRPSHFGFNSQTAGNNAFQSNPTDFSTEQVQDIAQLEFDAMVNQLITNGIEVIVFEDKGDTTPDSIFPNNWFSTFTNELVLYPMFSENRRLERKAEIYNQLSELLNKPVNNTLISLENTNEIVEGTGSLVCDYYTKTAFAALSERTTNNAIDQFEATTGYSSVRFNSYGPDNKLIYHTNVMLTMGDKYAVIGLNTIAKGEREGVRNKLASLNKDIVELSNDQVYHHFAGNMLQLANETGDKFLVMSKAAYNSLTASQIEQITVKHGNKIIACPIHMIEKVGGGSARCMMAEIFYS